MKYNSGSWVTEVRYGKVVGVDIHGYGYMKYNSGSLGTQTRVRVHTVQVRLLGYKDMDTGT